MLSNVLDKGYRRKNERGLERGNVVAVERNLSTSEGPSYRHPIAKSERDLIGNVRVESHRSYRSASESRDISLAI